MKIHHELSLIKIKSFHFCQFFSTEEKKVFFHFFNDKYGGDQKKKFTEIEDKNEIDLRK